MSGEGLAEMEKAAMMDALKRLREGAKAAIVGGADALTTLPGTSGGYAHVPNAVYDAMLGRRGLKDALQFYRERKEKILADNPMGAGLGEIGQAIFIGPSAKNFPHSKVPKAEKLEASGTPARDVWRDLGLWRGPDGKWRAEISDDEARVNMRNDVFDTATPTSPHALRTMYEHDALGNEYPDILNNKIFPSKDSGGAYYTDLKNPGGGKMSLPSKSKIDFASVAPHEIQHAIQDREGWARGGNPGEFDYKSLPEDLRLNKDLRSKIVEEIREIQRNSENGLWVSPGEAGYKRYQQLASELGKLGNLPEVDAYNRLAGEAEARATQRRLHLTPEQRRALFPVDSYDVPLDKLIIK